MPQRNLAEREANRLIELQKDGIAAEEEVDRAKSNADALRAACRAAEGRSGREARNIATIEARLEESVLKAPFDGIIAEVNCELGEFVTPSPVGIPTLPAVDLIDRSSMYVSAPLDEVDAPHVKVGMTARITLDAFGDRVFAGEVHASRPTCWTSRSRLERWRSKCGSPIPKTSHACFLATAPTSRSCSRRTRTCFACRPRPCSRATRSWCTTASGTLAERRFEKGLSSWR